MTKAMRRARLFLWLLAGLAPTASAPAPFTGVLPCKDDSRLAGQCFVVHGRLSVRANMRPYLWPVGTRRLLGIADPDGEIVMPADLERLFAAHLDRQAFGEFEVCPYSRQRPGIMQMVCIASVRHLVVREAP